MFVNPHSMSRNDIYPQTYTSYGGMMPATNKMINPEQEYPDTISTMMTKISEPGAMHPRDSPERIMYPDPEYPRKITKLMSNLAQTHDRTHSPGIAHLDQEYPGKITRLMSNLARPQYEQEDEEEDNLMNNKYGSGMKYPERNDRNVSQMKENEIFAGEMDPRPNGMAKPVGQMGGMLDKLQQERQEKQEKIAKMMGINGDHQMMTKYQMDGMKDSFPQRMMYPDPEYPGNIPRHMMTNQKSQMEKIPAGRVTGSNRQTAPRIMMGDGERLTYSGPKYRGKYSMRNTMRRGVVRINSLLNGDKVGQTQYQQPNRSGLWASLVRQYPSRKGALSGYEAPTAIMDPLLKRHPSYEEMASQLSSYSGYLDEAVAATREELETFFMDPYGLLAIFGFLIFLFYIIYEYLNASGNASRSLESDLFEVAELFKTQLCRHNNQTIPVAYLCR